MPIINVTLPSDGTNADVQDYNAPINAILAVTNGQLDDDNIASLSGNKIVAGTLPETALNASGKQGWFNQVTLPTTTVNNGNRSYTHTYPTSIAAIKSVGMRNRYTSTVPAPIQCTSLNGTTQFHSRVAPNGVTFTDDFVGGAWVKLSSYPTTSGVIIGRFDGTSGWSIEINSSGQVVQAGFNAGAANNTVVTSSQSVSLNRWAFIVPQLDMSTAGVSTTTSYVTIDGQDVPALKSTSGTAPTALIQAGNLSIGSKNGTNFFPGKIAQAFVTSAKLTQTQVKAIYSQGLVAGDVATYSIVSAFSLSGAAGLTDINTTNANNLTPNGSATTTAADSFSGQNASGVPTGTTNYSITTYISADGLTETVQVPEGNTIPTSGGITAVAYSTAGKPYGMPFFTRVLSEALSMSNQTTTSGTAVDLPGLEITIFVPTGASIKLSALSGTMTLSVTNNAAAISIFDVTSSTQLAQISGTTNASGDVAGCYLERTLTPPAFGLRTYRVQFRRGSNAATVSTNSSPTTPAFLKAEIVDL